MNTLPPHNPPENMRQTNCGIKTLLLWWKNCRGCCFSYNCLYMLIVCIFHQSHEPNSLQIIIHKCLCFSGKKKNCNLNECCGRMRDWCCKLIIVCVCVCDNWVVFFLGLQTSWCTWKICVCWEFLLYTRHVNPNSNIWSIFSWHNKHVHFRKKKNVSCLS